jgi:hypothetical protein
VRRRPIHLLIGLLLAAAAGVAGAPVATPAPTAPTCGSAAEPLVLEGTVEESDARSYRVLPFTVPPGAERVEVAYRWAEVQPLASTQLTKTTLDLGLWDEDGYRSAAGFRGWSGSRQQRAFVQEGAATRGYRPGAVRPGTWWVELGIAAVAPGGARWTVEVACTAAGPTDGRPRTPFPSRHVARSEPGWYHGDLHMHGYHSHASGPDWPDVVAQAVAAGLDFLPITDYVTDAHWAELGTVQRRHRDVLLWPGREIITYFGHANALGATPGVVEYRHGFEDVTLGGIQAAVKAAGGLFQVNHPTIFPTPVFQAFCRGCEFTLGDEIDWAQVDTIEVVTGPAVANASDAGAPVNPPLTAENPFIQTAIDLWERKLLEGYRIAPVSGSDSKGVERTDAERVRAGYGSSATAVQARNLSIAALHEAIAAGRVYVRARGVHGSPALELSATAPDGEQVTFGGTLPADAAVLEVTVRRGAGQLLRVIANGDAVLTVPLAGDEETVTVPIRRLPVTEGSGGVTFWRVETLDERSRTTIGNAVFLAGSGD